MQDADSPKLESRPSTDRASTITRLCVLRSTCRVQRAECSVQSAACRVQRAECSDDQRSRIGVSVVNRPSKYDHNGRHSVGCNCLGRQPTEQVLTGAQVSAVNRLSKYDHVSARRTSLVSAVNRPSKYDHRITRRRLSEQPSCSSSLGRQPAEQVRLPTARRSDRRTPSRLGRQPAEQVRSQRDTPRTL